MCKPGDDSKGSELIFDIFDTQTEYKVSVRAKHNIKMCRELIEELKTNEIAFTVTS